MKNSIFRLLQAVVFFCAALMVSACGAGSSSSGDDFMEENLNKVKKGMSPEEVEDLLGEPYAVITSLVTGEMVYEYEILGAKSFAGGFIYVAGVVDLRGSKVTIDFDRNGRVEKIVYENTGEELYEEYRQ